MGWILYPIVEAVLTTTFLFTVLDLSIRKHFIKFIVNILLIFIVKAVITFFWSEVNLTYRTLACIPLQLTIFYLLLRKNLWYLLCCTILEFIILELCKSIILLMIFTSADEMYKFESAIKICSYLQYLIILLIVVNYKQQEIITKKDFYIKNAENTMLNLRRQKHNFDNLLNTITGLINLEQYNKLKEFVKGAQTETNELQKCKNLCLSALITQKMNGFNDKVKVSIKIRSGLDNLNMTDNELCECVGILLDNAFEAAIMTEQPYIGIEIFDMMENTVIRVRNSCCEIIDKMKFFNKGYTTKGKGRGLGLFIVKVIMSKYGNDMDVIVDENEVRFSLIIHHEIKASQMPGFLENRIPAAFYSRIHGKA